MDTKLAVLSALLLGAPLQADPKLKKDDIPKNEKQMWKRITASEKDIEENLMSGDPRFLAELALARRKVADLMLNAEGDKKNKAVVSDLSRCWNYWVRETDEIVTEDLKEYNLATAAGKSFDPADNNPQGGNPYIGMPVPPSAPYYQQPEPETQYQSQPTGADQGPAAYISPLYISPIGSGLIDLNPAQYNQPFPFHFGRRRGVVKVPAPPRPGSAYRGSGYRSTRIGSGTYRATSYRATPTRATTATSSTTYRATSYQTARGRSK